MKLDFKFTETDRSCSLEIVEQLFDQPHFFSSLANLKKKIAIITDDQVFSLYGLPLQQSLREKGIDADLFTFPHGEASKTRETKQKLEDQLLEHHFNRHSSLIAIGGGVVTDLVGFLASTYCRGIPFISIPTSLIAMIDASIGGKTAVNTSKGKNMIGSFYQPTKIWIDLAMLKTLPERELKSGIVEMLKHGLIADAHHFDFLVNNRKELLSQDSTILKQTIFESCKIKRDIVEEDEKESGKREILNFGHTVGHAIEIISHFKISHGEAVAMGILVESELAKNLGYLNSKDHTQIKTAFKAYLPAINLQNLSSDALIEQMSMDKKNKGKEPSFVILNGIGSCLESEGSFSTPIKKEQIKAALNTLSQCI